MQENVVHGKGRARDGGEFRNWRCHGDTFFAVGGVPLDNRSQHGQPGESCEPVQSPETLHRHRRRDQRKGRGEHRRKDGAKIREIGRPGEQRGHSGKRLHRGHEPGVV